MNWPAPGIHFGVSEADYHAVSHDVALSKSHLWDFYPSPWAWQRREPKKVTDAMVWGSLVDCLLLQPDQFDACFAVSPFDEFRTNEAKGWRAMQVLPIITQDTLDRARKAVEILQENSFVKDLLENAELQVSCVNRRSLPQIGANYTAKARIDIWPNRSVSNCLWDLKTVSSLNRLEWTILDRGYDAQAAWYLDVANGLGNDFRGFGFIFQESSPPYEIALVMLDEESIMEGMEWCKKAIQKWHECQTTGIYPSPTAESVRVISLPKRYEP